MAVGLLNEENQELCRKVLGIYRERNQMLKLMEEMAELTQVLCKMMESTDGDEMVELYEHFAEELSDVVVMLEEMRTDTRLSMDEINERAKAKLLRTLERAKE